MWCSIGTVGGVKAQKINDRIKAEGFTPQIRLKPRVEQEHDNESGSLWLQANKSGRDVTQTGKSSLNTPSPLCSEASTTYCADAASNLVLPNERTALVRPSPQNREPERGRESLF